MTTTEFFALLFLGALILMAPFIVADMLGDVTVGQSIADLVSTQGK